MKIVEAYKDETHAILIIPEGHTFLHVQLVSYVPRMLKNHENFLEEHLSALVIEDKTVIVVRHDGVVNTNLKTEVAEAVSYFNKRLAIIRQAQEHIEGALRDYVKPTK